MREFGHIADEVDDLLDIVVAEEVMSRCHFYGYINQLYSNHVAVMLFADGGQGA